MAWGQLPPAAPACRERHQAEGEEHPDTLTSMNNLATTLRAQRDLAGARELEEQVRRVRGKKGEVG